MSQAQNRPSSTDPIKATKTVTFVGEDIKGNEEEKVVDNAASPTPPPPPPRMTSKFGGLAAVQQCEVTVQFVMIMG